MIRRVFKLFNLSKCLSKTYYKTPSKLRLLEETTRIKEILYNFEPISSNIFNSIQIMKKNKYKNISVVSSYYRDGLSQKYILSKIMDFNTKFIKNENELVTSNIVYEKLFRHSHIFSVNIKKPILTWNNLKRHNLPKMNTLYYESIRFYNTPVDAKYRIARINEAYLHYTHLSNCSMSESHTDITDDDPLQVFLPETEVILPPHIKHNDVEENELIIERIHPTITNSNTISPWDEEQRSIRNVSLSPEWMKKVDWEKTAAVQISDVLEQYVDKDWYIEDWSSVEARFTSDRLTYIKNILFPGSFMIFLNTRKTISGNKPDNISVYTNGEDRIVHKKGSKPKPLSTESSSRPVNSTFEYIKSNIFEDNLEHRKTRSYYFDHFSKITYNNGPVDFDIYLQNIPESARKAIEAYPQDMSIRPGQVYLVNWHLPVTPPAPDHIPSKLVRDFESNQYRVYYCAITFLIGDYLRGTTRQFDGTGPTPAYAQAVARSKVIALSNFSMPPMDNIDLLGLFHINKIDQWKPVFPKFNINLELPNIDWFSALESTSNYIIPPKSQYLAHHRALRHPVNGWYPRDHPEDGYYYKAGGTGEARIASFYDKVLNHPDILDNIEVPEIRNIGIDNKGRPISVTRDSTGTIIEDCNQTDWALDPRLDINNIEVSATTNKKKFIDILSTPKKKIPNQNSFSIKELRSLGIIKDNTYNLSDKIKDFSTTPSELLNLLNRERKAALQRKRLGLPIQPTDEKELLIKVRERIKDIFSNKTEKHLMKKEKVSIVLSELNEKRKKPIQRKKKENHPLTGEPIYEMKLSRDELIELNTASVPTIGSYFTVTEPFTIKQTPRIPGETDIGIAFDERRILDEPLPLQYVGPPKDPEVEYLQYEAKRVLEQHRQARPALMERLPEKMRNLMLKVRKFGTVPNINHIIDTNKKELEIIKLKFRSKNIKNKINLLPKYMVSRKFSSIKPKIKSLKMIPNNTDIQYSKPNNSKNTYINNTNMQVNTGLKCIKRSNTKYFKQNFKRRDIDIKDNNENFSNNNTLKAKKLVQVNSYRNIQRNNIDISLKSSFNIGKENEKANFKENGLLYTINKRKRSPMKYNINHRIKNELQYNKDLIDGKKICHNVTELEPQVFTGKVDDNLRRVEGNEIYHESNLKQLAFKLTNVKVTNETNCKNKKSFNIPQFISENNLQNTIIKNGNYLSSYEKYEKSNIRNEIENKSNSILKDNRKSQCVDSNITENKISFFEDKQHKNTYSSENKINRQTSDTTDGYGYVSKDNASENKKQSQLKQKPKNDLDIKTKELVINNKGSTLFNSDSYITKLSKVNTSEFPVIKFTLSDYKYEKYKSVEKHNDLKIFETQENSQTSNKNRSENTLSKTDEKKSEKNLNNSISYDSESELNKERNFFNLFNYTLLDPSNPVSFCSKDMENLFIKMKLLFRDNRNLTPKFHQKVMDNLHLSEPYYALLPIRTRQLLIMVLQYIEASLLEKPVSYMIDFISLLSRYHYFTPQNISDSSGFIWISAEGYLHTIQLNRWNGMNEARHSFILIRFKEQIFYYAEIMAVFKETRTIIVTLLYEVNCPGTEGVSNYSPLSVIFLPRNLTYVEDDISFSNEFKARSLARVKPQEFNMDTYMEVTTTEDIDALYGTYTEPVPLFDNLNKPWLNNTHSRYKFGEDNSRGRFGRQDITSRPRGPGDWKRAYEIGEPLP